MRLRRLTVLRRSPAVRPAAAGRIVPMAAATLPGALLFWTTLLILPHTARAQETAPAAAAPARPAAPAETAAAAPAATKAAPAPETTDAPTQPAERTLTLRALDRVTGRTADLALRPGQWGRFGSILVLARACVGTRPEYQPNDRGFFEVVEVRPDGRKIRLFSGWSFAASPALNAMEHPRYDVWLTSCRMHFPETGPDTVVISRRSRAPATDKGEPPATAAAPDGPASTDAASGPD